MNPLLLQLEAAITAADWKSSWLQYEALVDGCNRCHAATEHEYIEILTTENVPSVFNQKF